MRLNGSKLLKLLSSFVIRKPQPAKHFLYSKPELHESSKIVFTLNIYNIIYIA